SSTRTPYSGARMAADTAPLTAPDHVFPGLSAGASFRPPIMDPPSMANVSQIQVTTSGRKTSHVAPHGVEADPRSQMRKDGRAPVYTAPNSVTEIASSGRASGPRSRSADSMTAITQAATSRLTQLTSSARRPATAVASSGKATAAPTPSG